MPLTLRTLTAGPATGAPVLAVGLHARADGVTVPPAAGVTFDPAFFVARGFEAKVDQVLAVPADDGGVILAVGLGDPARITATSLRRAAALAVRQAGPATTLDLDLLADLPATLDTAVAAQRRGRGRRPGGATPTPRGARRRSRPRSRRCAVVGRRRGGGGRRSRPSPGPRPWPGTS